MLSRYIAVGLFIVYGRTHWQRFLMTLSVSGDTNLEQEANIDSSSGLPTRSLTSENGYNHIRNLFELQMDLVFRNFTTLEGGTRRI